MNLPLELLAEIFKYNNGDHKTLYSCILVNKQWHNIHIPILWENPLYSKGSIKIIINCLLEEDKDFLTENNIELTFKLLDKSPLYNYAKFCTRFHLIDYRFPPLLRNISKFDLLKNRLVDFILDHLVIIREFSTSNIASYLVNNCHRFGNSFQNLNKLVCYGTVSSNKFIDKLANICKCIQSLEIYCACNDELQDSLSQLIKAQNQIKHLTISLDANHQPLLDNFQKAILTHSQSIIYYRSNGLNIGHILLPTFTNLKTLSYSSNSKTKWMKNISLPNIESVSLHTSYQLFLSDLSDFININGKTIKYLNASGYPDDSEFLGKLFQSIAQCCNNLVDLSILYNDEVNQELTEVFNNCIKLENIEFRMNFDNDILDGDKILSVLNQTLPKKLKSIMFPCHSSTINANSFSNLVKNWKGPKPFTIKFRDCHKLVD